MIDNPGRLLGSFRRPPDWNISGFDREIVLDSCPLPGLRLDNRIARDLISRFYTAKAPVWVGTEDPGPYEHAVLAMWQQQWSRLKHNFTFCTGAFDLRLIDGRPFQLLISDPRTARLLGPEAPARETGDSSGWVGIASKDLTLPVHGLRPILEILGQDADSRLHFRSFVTLFDRLQNHMTSTDLLAALSEMFGNRASSSMRAFFGPIDESQLPPAIRPSDEEAVRALIASSDTFDYADIGLADTMAGIVARNPSSAVRLLALLEGATDKLEVQRPARIDLVHSLAEGFTGSAKATTMSALWDASPSTACLVANAFPARVAALLPAMSLDSGARLVRTVTDALDVSELKDLLADLAETGTLDRCGSESLSRDSRVVLLSLLADGLIDTWPDTWSNDSVPEVDSWIRILGERPNHGILRLACSVAPWPSSHLAKVSASSWLSALTEQRSTPECEVAAYLLLGRRGKRSDGEPFTEAFISLHRRLGTSDLPGQTWKELDHKLPKPWPWNEWDRNERLRRDYAKRVVKNDWSPIVLDRLSATGDQALTSKVRAELLDLGSGGQKYTQRLDRTSD